MAEPLLKVQDLSAAIEEGELLHHINLDVNTGETHVLMGPNGAGKSTLGYTLMGNPAYKVTGGKIFFDGEDVTALSADKRARMGMFLSFRIPWRYPASPWRAFFAMRSAREPASPSRSSSSRRSSRRPWPFCRWIPPMRTGI